MLSPQPLKRPADNREEVREPLADLPEGLARIRVGPPL